MILRVIFLNTYSQKSNINNWNHHDRGLQQSFAKELPKY